VEIIVIHDFRKDFFMLPSVFINAFMTLTVIVDPVGTAAAFAGRSSGFEIHQARRIALKSVVIAFTLLLLAGLFGNALLNKIGITFSAFRIAGGILLFATASRMIFGCRDQKLTKENVGMSHDITVFPLAIPLLAGPGCMTAMALLMEKTDSWQDSMLVITALVLTHVTALICLIGANYIRKFLGMDGADIVARVMGIILAAMSVQFIIDGIHGA